MVQKRAADYAKQSFTLVATLAVLLAMLVVPVTAAKAQSWSHPNFTTNGIPTNGEVLFGAATIDDITNLESQVGGPVGIRRSYYKAGQEGSAIARATDDIAHGRVPWLSFKLPYGWADMANGRGDAWATDLADRLGQLNGPVWIALHHEPEGDGNHPDWVAMQRHLSPLFRQHDNIAFTIILMGWHQFLSGNTAYSMDNFWPGKEHVDVLGFDPYNFYATTRSNGTMNWAWDELSKYYDGITKWLRNSGNQDVPWAIAETGYSDTAASIPRNYVAPNGKTVSTAGTGADWLTRAYDDMASRRRSRPGLLQRRRHRQQRTQRLDLAHHQQPQTHHLRQHPRPQPPHHRPHTTDRQPPLGSHQCRSQGRRRFR